MKQTKQVSARIGTDFIEMYVKSYKEYQKEFFPDALVRDITMTSMLEEALYYASKYFDQSIEEK